MTCFSRTFIFVAFLCLISGKNLHTEILRSAVLVPDNKDPTYVIVNGFRSCGGQGVLVEWSAEACKSHFQICKYPTDGIYRSGIITFVPSKNVEQLGLRIFSSNKVGHSIMLMDIPLQKSSVKAGQTYNLITTGAVSEGIKGTKSTAQVVLYRKVDDVVEICAEADFEIA